MVYDVWIRFRLRLKARDKDDAEDICNRIGVSMADDIHDHSLLIESEFDGLCGTGGKPVELNRVALAINYTDQHRVVFHGGRAKFEVLWGGKWDEVCTVSCPCSPPSLAYVIDGVPEEFEEQISRILRNGLREEDL